MTKTIEQSNDQEEESTSTLPQPTIVTPGMLQSIKDNWLDFQSKHLEHFVKVTSEQLALPLLQPVMQGYISLILTIDDLTARNQALEAELKAAQQRLLLTI